MVTSAGWTLAIAGCTFITLVYPMGRLAAHLESHRAVWILWGVIWACGLIPAIFGTVSLISARTSRRALTFSPSFGLRSSSRWWTMEESAGTPATRYSPKS